MDKDRKGHHYWNNIIIRWWVCTIPYLLESSYSVLLHPAYLMILQLVDTVELLDRPLTLFTGYYVTNDHTLSA